MKDPAAAEDLAADTFVELCLKKSRFKPQYSFKTWLFCIARNNALDYLRKQKRRPTLPLEEAVYVEQQSLEKKVLRNEQLRHLSRIMDTLRPAYREMLHLLYFFVSADRLPHNKNLMCRIIRAERPIPCA